MYSYDSLRNFYGYHEETIRIGERYNFLLYLPINRHALANSMQAPKGSTGREDPDPLRGGLTVREGRHEALEERVNVP